LYTVLRPKLNRVALNEIQNNNASDSFHPNVNNVINILVYRVVFRIKAMSLNRFIWDKTND